MVGILTTLIMVSLSACKNTEQPVPEKEETASEKEEAVPEKEAAANILKMIRQLMHVWEKMTVLQTGAPWRAGWSVWRALAQEPWRRDGLTMQWLFGKNK